MSENMFHHLVALFEVTHQQLQAVRSVDITLKMGLMQALGGKV